MDHLFVFERCSIYLRFSFNDLKVFEIGALVYQFYVREVIKAPDIETVASLDAILPHRLLPTMSSPRIQEDVEDTKVILHSSIEAVLERGEKLDDLVSRSEVLSAQSKTFYKTARKTNACCNFG